MCLNKPVSIEPIEEYLRYWSLIPTHKLDPYAGIMSRMLWIPGHKIMFHGGLFPQPSRKFLKPSQGQYLYYIRSLTLSVWQLPRS